MARPENPVVKSKIAPLQQRDAQFFNELIQINNVYSKALGEKTQKEFIIKFLESKRTNLQKSKEKEFEVMETVLPKGKLSYKKIITKKEMLEKIDGELEQFKKSLKATEGQISQYYDMFVEAGIRTKENVNRIFGKAQTKDIVPDRQVSEDEEILFESDFEKLVQDEETRKQFTEAKKEAVKRNVQRKTKGQK